MKILLLGANGQVGHALRAPLSAQAELLVATRSGRLGDGSPCLTADLEAPEALADLVQALAPDWVVNAAAYTAVDRAEDEPALAHRINAEAPGLLARACAAAGSGLVHLSTDYVFDGTAGRPYLESDPASPLGVYGESKWQGEQAVRASNARHLIFRLSWVYAARGGNFLLTMLRLARERGQLGVVDDQIGAPTAAHCIAHALAHALARPPVASGTWHLTASGRASWHDFAAAIFEGAVARGLLPAAPVLSPIASHEYPTRARRPADSRLDSSAFTRDFGFHIDDWHRGLDEVLDQLAGEEVPT
ncbi:dTDP-4-dehydrorhamnose reductase [Arenimonas alkanexedens]